MLVIKKLNKTHYHILKELLDDSFEGTNDYANNKMIKDLEHKSYCFFGIFLDNELIANIAYQKCKKPVLKPFEILKYINIFALAVKKGHRRKGYAKRLIFKVLEEAKKLSCYTCTLIVKPSNIKAINCYKSMSFEVYNEIPNYFGKGQKALTMCIYI